MGLHKSSEMIPRMLVCSDLVEEIVQYICLVLSSFMREDRCRIGKMVRKQQHDESSIK